MLVSMLIAVPAFVVLAGTLLLAMRFGVNAEAFFTQIEKLADSGNYERAMKLCRAVPDAPVSRIIRKGLEMKLVGDFTTEEEVEDAAVEALMPEAEAESRRFMPIAWMAVFGIGPAVALPVLPMGEPMIRIAGAIALLFISANLVRFTFGLRRDTYAAIGVVAPHVQAERAQEQLH